MVPNANINYSPHRLSLFPLSAEGRFLYMLETGIRGGYEARMNLPFVNTTDKCLRFSYTFYGKGPATLQVLVSDQDLIETSILKVEADEGGVTSGVWKVHLSKLPEGLNMLVMEGRRGDSGISGLGLDDIELSLCSKFRGKYPTSSLNVLNKSLQTVTIWKV